METKPSALRHLSMNWLDRFLTVEGLSATYALMWGMWLANPLLDTFGGSPTYHSMSFFASEIVWGGWLFGLGAIILYFIARRKLHLIAFPLATLSATWIFIAIMLARANLSSTGLVSYGTLALYSCLALMRYYVNHDYFSTAHS